MSRNALIIAAAVLVIVGLVLFSWYATGPSVPAEDQRSPTGQAAPAEGGTLRPPGR